MARRRHAEEHENHERWLVSYADFITLLFAFFVVMYSVSSVNEGKMRVLSDSMVATFKDRKRSLEPIQVGKLVRSTYVDNISLATSPVVVSPDLPPASSSPDADGDPLNQAESTNGGDGGDGDGDGGEGDGDGGNTTQGTEEDLAELTGRAGEGGGFFGDSAGTVAFEGHPGETQTEELASGQEVGAPMQAVDSVARQVQQAMAPLIEQDLVEVRRGESWLEVEFKSKILFGSGNAQLSSKAVSVLADIAEILKAFPNPVQVEGFSDNVPIRTPTYPTNWELSAARAASVVHLFMKYGVRPDRMVAIGYGEYQPIADNATAEGRSRNRRVVLVIPAQENARQILDLQRLSSTVATPPTGG